MAESKKKISILLDLAGNFVTEMKKAVSSVQKFKSDMGKSQSNFRLDIDTSIAHMKMGDLKKLYAALKIQMGQKVKFNVDEVSLERTAVAMDAVRAKMRMINSESKASSGGIGLAFGKIGATLGIGFGVHEIASFTMEAIKANAEVEDLRAGFEGSATDIALMKKATADMVDDGDLLRLSNQASALGIGIKDQPKLFLLAANAGKKMGKDVNAGFEAIISTTEGMTRGLKGLGIERSKYNQEVARLAKLEGGKLNDLDAETQKRVKIQALLNVSKLTMDDVNKNQATMNQQLKSLPALIHEAKENFGSMFDPLLKIALPTVIKALKDVARGIKEVAIGRGKVAAEGITYDFTGTTEKEREDLIADWQVKAAESTAKFAAARAKFVSYKMGSEEFQKIKVDTERDFAVYQRLIELAREYKEETKDGKGGGLTEDAMAKMAKEELEFYKLRYDLNMMSGIDYENYLKKRLAGAKQGTKDELEIYKGLQDEMNKVYKTFKPEIKEDFNFENEAQEKLFGKIKEAFKTQGIPWNEDAKALALQMALTTGDNSKIARTIFEQIKSGFETRGLPWNAETEAFVVTIIQQIVTIDSRGQSKGLKEVPVPNKPEPDVSLTKDQENTKEALNQVGKAAEMAGDAMVEAFWGVHLTLGQVISDIGQMAAKLWVVAGIKAGIGALFPTLAPFLHEGGPVEGARQFRLVPMKFFSNAKRYHGGKDVPAILQSDEVVYTAAQQKRITNLLLSSNSAAAQGNGRNVFVFKNLLDGQKFIEENMNKHAARIR